MRVPLPFLRCRNGERPAASRMSKIISVPGRAVSLTDAETRLLSVLAAAPDHVFSREELLSQVFSDGSDMGTVDVYVSYLRGKTTRTIIETVRGRGYRIDSPEGATVAVSLGCARHRQWAQIRVSDHGPGIGGDPERLFRRFARDDDGTAHQGYGLGLALARDMANRYGGSVAVESSSPSGTTMLLSFPLA